MKYSSSYVSTFLLKPVKIVTDINSLEMSTSGNDVSTSIRHQHIQPFWTMYDDYFFFISILLCLNQALA